MRRLFRSVTSRVRRLPRAVLIGAALVVMGGLVVGGVYAYRVYNYVQHDNEFCLSCHLMVNPYERFAKSAHRDLGCKSCHHPTPVARAKMALTQILENPESLSVHAEVPNSACEKCHVKGDSTKWKIIAQTAGHRVHFESKDPKLKGLECVECHSTSLHEFSTIDRTCAQSGCHEGIKVTLGKMSNLTLHCAACHDFTRPVAKKVSTDSLGVMLRPEGENCFSCHEMRKRVQMPPDEPHHGACGLCHNPHKQTTPHEAVNTCANSGCHSSPDSITPMHRGLPPAKLADCVTCHKAHEFRIDMAKTQCSSCHTSVPETAKFPHSRHGSVTCSQCHDMTEKHGALKITSQAQCQSCHHSTQAAANCTACHSVNEIAGKRFAKAQTMTIAGNAKTRTLNFDHGEHRGVACAECHKEPTTRSAAGVQCAQCHESHHRATTNCRECHAQSTTRAHTRNVHLGCAGSSCHKALPNALASVPHTRPFCLACHQKMVNHKPAGNCADCHKLPAARGTQ